MRRQRWIYLIAGLLVLEAAAAVAFPARIPRAARLPTAGTALAAAAGVWLIGRQKFGGR